MRLVRNFSVNSISAGFEFIAAAQDTIPDQFTFVSTTEAEVGTEYSSSTAITGVDNGVLLVATNGQVSNNQGVSWSTSASMVVGQTLVRATLTSSTSNSTTVSVTVTVNTMSAVFSIRTRVLTSQPNQFTFDNITGANLNTDYESVQPIVGVDPGAVVAVQSAGGQVSNDGGATWLLSVAMVVGSTFVKATVTSSQTHSETRALTVTINGVSSTYTVRTKVAAVIIERTEDSAPRGIYMSEIDAVNMLLRAIGSTPVNSLSAVHPDVANARVALNRARNKGQHRGWWYNTDYGTQLVPNEDGEIVVPQQVSTLVCNSRNYVRRGDKVYNKLTNSYIFTAVIDIHRLVRILDWEDMPDCMREYCAYLAAAEFVRDELEDPQKEAEFNNRAIQSRFDVQKRDLEEGRYNMFSSSRTVQARAGSRPYGGVSITPEGF